MQFSINKSNIRLYILLLMGLATTACNSGQREDDGHDHDHGESEATTVASLTPDQINAVGISFGTIEQRDLTATIKANGILRVPNNHRANATTLYGGVVKQLHVQLGDPVRKGQVIATIVNPQFVQLQEAYLTATSELILAEQELQRQQALNDGNAGAKRNLENAISQLNTLRTRKASLREQIQLMGINPDTVNASSLQSALTVTSPIGGVVSAVYAKLGSYVDVSSPLVEVVDNQMIHLDLQVFERDLPAMRIGQVIHFNLTNHPTTVYTARVFRIGASFENESKTVAVHSQVTGDKTSLIDGMHITGTVSLGNVSTSAVPDDAIVSADGKYYIFIETDKEQEEAHGAHEGHDHGEEAHKHEASDEHDHADDHEHEPAGNRVSFEKVEVVKGVSDMGYTAITPVVDIPAGTPIVIKGAFFINAKMSGSVGHSH